MEVEKAQKDTKSDQMMNLQNQQIDIYIYMYIYVLILVDIFCAFFCFVNGCTSNFSSRLWSSCQMMVVRSGTRRGSRAEMLGWCL